MLEMKTIQLLTVLAVSLMCGAAACQTTPEPKGDEKDTEAADPGIPADFNDYLRKVYPGLDPGGEHDLFALKDPKDKDKRHEYTIAMTQMIIDYMMALDMGSTIAKVFDQYSRGKEANQVTFKVLHAIVLLHYPPGRPNVNEAEKLLREAAEKAPDYAFPWFLLAQYFEFPRLMQIADTSPRDVLADLDKALEINPKFLRAVLLKSQVYLRANPPRVVEVKEMIAPFLVTLPPVLDDFHDLMMVFAATHSDAELTAKIKELKESGKLTDQQHVRCLRVKVHGQLQLYQFDAAIETLEEMVKLIKPVESPADAIAVNQQLAACWGSKAMRIKQTDPEFIEPGNSEKFAQFSEVAATLHALCAELERKYLPLALRGMQARMYVEFLVYGLGKAEMGLDWLTKYLAETDLSTAQRTVLDNLHNKVGIIVNPTEEGLLTLYEGYVAADDMENLAISLIAAENNMKVQQEHFKTERALTFFIGQLDNRIRLTVGSAAILAADTALQIGADAIQRAGEAIATRLEKETELNSDEQAKLQGQLCDALMLVGHRPSQERGIRHAAKMIEESTADNIRNMMPAVLNAWQGEKFWKGLKTPPAAPGVMDRRDPKKAAAWLKKLADAVKAEIVKPE
jgi:tetratricopeptide (TPR) repeat protein